MENIKATEYELIKGHLIALAVRMKLLSEAYAKLEASIGEIK